MEKREILSIIYDAIVETSPYASELLSARFSNTVQDNVCLVDLGLNSIDYAQISHIVMNQLKVRCPLEVFINTNNIKDIVDIFYERLPTSE